MSSLSFIEKENLEEFLGMGGGYVLDFNDRTYDTFFRDEVGVNIRTGKYAQNGNSKAKRLRCFWDIQNDKIVAKALQQFIVYVKYKRISPSIDKVETVQLIVNRLLGIEKNPETEMSENDFLEKEFDDINISGLPIESVFTDVMNERIQELTQCMNQKIPLASIFHCGSILEGLLLGLAQKEPRKFNSSSVAPKDKSGKVLHFQKWSLASLIDVATDVEILTLDIKKFSHGLRDFRNYIHPFEQATSKFKPDQQTSQICFQVLKAAVIRIRDNSKGDL